MKLKERNIRRPMPTFGKGIKKYTLVNFRAVLDLFDAFLPSFKVFMCLTPSQLINFRKYFTEYNTNS